MKNIIQLKNVKKTYVLDKTEVPVLHNINLEIGSGEMIAIIGPSGSGKSTLAEKLCAEQPSPIRISQDDQGKQGHIDNKAFDSMFLGYDK